MSRYVCEKGDIEIHYGFDSPLRQYFAQTWVNGKCVSEVNSRSDVLDLLDGSTAPVNHIGSIAMDLEF